MTEPAKTCGCCGKARAPTLVKSYLNKQMCVECVRGFVSVFAQDPDPVEPPWFVAAIVDDDYDPA